MRFYDAIQLDPSILKTKIHSAETTKEKHQLWLAMVVRALLLVAFATLLIGPVAPVFGPENSCMAVGLFCIMLGLRFVDFGYCMTDALINLAASFLLLLFMPPLAVLVGPIPGVLVHFAAVFLLLVITSDRPEMGNGGLYTFAYILLSGNPVTGELLWKRAALTAVGYVICALVYFLNHRTKNAEMRFHHLMSQFHLSKKKCRWQFQFSLGLSLILSLGALLGLERAMWAGFACGSMLGCYSGISTVKERFWQRIVGVVIGSTLFFVIYQLAPPSMQGLFGPLGGFCLGFCTEYKYKTAMNCFGALMMATGLYGLHGSVLLRIVNNLLGAAFGFAFVFVYQKLMDHFLEPVSE